MTDLTQEELRRACVLAGLTLLQPEPDGVPWAEYTDEQGNCIAEDHPALLAWVADLLVARCRSMNRLWDLSVALGRNVVESHGADSAQRIRAALEVLKL